MLLACEIAQHEHALTYQCILFWYYFYIANDKTVLVIPRPGSKSSLKVEVAKVLDPFSLEVWIMILCIISLTALLSVWFSQKRVKRRSVYARGSIYTRLFVDHLLEKSAVR